MTINHDKKLIFIHIPKNAGTSIIEALGIENIFIDKTLDEYKNHYKLYWNTYTKFAVVRDPIDRFISSYKFARMNESGWFSSTGQEGLEKHVHHKLCNELDINEYVQYLYQNKEEWNIWNLPQTFFIQNESGDIELDFLLRYENLEKEICKLGINKLKKLNSSTIQEKNLISLTNYSKNLLYKVYDIDYKNFQYKKNFTPTNFSYY